jgi:hypothetical protein
VAIADKFIDRKIKQMEKALAEAIWSSATWNKTSSPLVMKQEGMAATKWVVLKVLDWARVGWMCAYSFVSAFRYDFVFMDFWHVQKKLWEKVDGQWNGALRIASSENWLLLPSSVVKVSVTKHCGCAMDQKTASSWTFPFP